MIFKKSQQTNLPENSMSVDIALEDILDFLDSTKLGLRLIPWFAFLLIKVITLVLGSMGFVDY